MFSTNLVDKSISKSNNCNKTYIFQNFTIINIRKGGTKVYINRPGRITKMAAMPIYDKNR